MKMFSITLEAFNLALLYSYKEWNLACLINKINIKYDLNT